MGYDITFHPISMGELKRFIFDVLEKPELAAERANEISKQPEELEHITYLYQKLVEFKKEVLTGKAQFSSTLAFGTAAIAGFLHPYWYARGACVSFLCDEEPHFHTYLQSLSSLSPATFYGIKDDTGGQIVSNYVGGGYISHMKLRELKQDLLNNRFAMAVASVFGGEVQSLLKAIDYALAKGTGILEASDIVVPTTNECYSCFANLRAEFLGNT